MRGEYSRVGDVPNQLYLEREHIPWYLKAATTVSTWFALAGYTLFALVFTSQKDNIKVSRGVLTALASAFLIIGYAGAAAAFVFGRSLLFRLDSVYLPYLLTSIAGLIEIVANHSIHKKFPVSDAHIVAPLVIASITTVFFAAVALLAWRRVNNMKTVGERTGAKLQTWETPRSGYYSDPMAATEMMPMEVPEDEAQRRQLLRLLLARERGARGPSPSPDTSSMYSTYRIDLPEEYNRVPPNGRPRRGSEPSISDKWTVKNLLGHRKQSSKDNNVDVEEEREKRRRQIERDSLTSLSQPALEQAMSNYENGASNGARSSQRASYA